MNLRIIYRILFGLWLSLPACGQTVTPLPRSGTVIWNRVLTNFGAPVSLALDKQDRPVVVAARLNPTNYVILADGGVVSQPVLGDSGNFFSISRFGSNTWSIFPRDPVDRSFAPSYVLATKQNTLIGDGYSGFEVGAGVERLFKVDGSTGAQTHKTIGRYPPRILRGFASGFVPGGDVIFFEDAGQASKAFYLASPETLTLGHRVLFDARWEPYPYDRQPNQSFRGPPVVVLPEGLVVIGAINRRDNLSEPVAGLIVIDPRNVFDQGRFLELPFTSLRVTGLTVGRDGYVYCSMSSAWIQIVTNPMRGALARVNVATGEASLFGNIVDSVETPVVITKEGILLVASRTQFLGQGDAKLTAIATGSKGGLALSPWPRSTGDNQNSFREQALDDSDGDGLTDDDERLVYGTNPLKADSDGDGYSDLVEITDGSNPNSATDVPELMEAQLAVKLSFGTTVGQTYQLQSSSDLITWANFGDSFVGTGVRQSQLVDAQSTGKYWRLQRVQ